MNKKTSTTLLHEYLQARKLPLPTYTIEEIPGGQFRCKAQAAGKKATGSATSKKLAKQESCRLLLNSLNSLNFSSVQQSAPTIKLNTKPENSSVPCTLHNYIGELNEYASKNGIAYPVYILLHAKNNAEVIISCTFMNHQAIGKGKNQKEAKQNSAKNMLQFYLHKYDNITKSTASSSAIQKKQNVKQKVTVLNCDKPKGVETLVDVLKDLSLKQKKTDDKGSRRRYKLQLVIDL